MPEESNVQSTANVVKGIVEAVPIYQDLLQPATKEVGAALAKTVYLLLSPVSGMVWGFDQIKDFVGKRVGEKLRGVPPERLRPPDASVAGPALEALRYAGHKEELRELYASLLATAMDTETASQAHPAFVEVIRQMSPDEAKIIDLLFRAGAQPLLDLRSYSPHPVPGGRWVLRNFTLLPYDSRCATPDNGPAYLVNLQRLGLVEMRDNYALVSVGGIDLYQGLRDHPYYGAVNESIRAENRSPQELVGAVHMTAFGRQFCMACIYAPTMTTWTNVSDESTQTPVPPPGTI